MSIQKNGYVVLFQNNKNSLIKSEIESWANFNVIIILNNEYRK